VSTGPLLAILGVAALLRFYRLELDGLWYDTASSISTASNPSLGEVIEATKAEIQFPLYFLILHFWLKVNGSEFWVRTLSVLLGLGTIGMVYVTGKAFFSKRVGLLAAALAAVSSYQLYYSRYPRSYILLALLTMASVYLLRQAFVDRRRGWWIAYTLVTLMALYTHPYAFTLVLGQWLFAGIIILRGHRWAAWPWLASQLALLAGLAPWLPTMFTHYRSQEAGIDAWIAPVDSMNVVQLLDWLWFRTKGDYGHRLDRALYYSRDLLTLVALLGLFLGGYLREKALLVVAILVPIIFVFLVSLLVQPIWVLRYFVFISGPFCILVAYALWALWERGRQLGKAISILSLVLLVFTSALPIWSLFNDDVFRNADVRTAASWIRSQYQDGDIIVHTNYQSYLPSVWYNRRAGLAENRPLQYQILRAWESMPEAWCLAAPYNETYMSLDYLDLQQVDHAQRVWLVILYNHRTQNESAQELDRLLQSAATRVPPTYGLRARQDFLGVTFLLYEKT